MLYTHDPTHADMVDSVGFGVRYDSFHWMEKYGDPDKFEKHAVVAKIWGLLAIQFASDIGLPLNVSVLGERLIQYGNEAETALQQSTVSGDLTELKAAIVAYKEEADVFMSLLTGSVMNNTMLAQVRPCVRVWVGTQHVSFLYTSRSMLVCFRLTRCFDAEIVSLLRTRSVLQCHMTTALMDVDVHCVSARMPR